MLKSQVRFQVLGPALLSATETLRLANQFCFLQKEAQKPGDTETIALAVSPWNCPSGPKHLQGLHIKGL